MENFIIDKTIDFEIEKTDPYMTKNKIVKRSFDQSIKADSKFEQHYQRLSYYQIDIFCILSVNQVAASSEVGFISPIDNKNWQDAICFYPEYDLINHSNKISSPSIFVKVPLRWALNCELEIENENDWLNEGLKFCTSYSTLLPYNEIIDYYVLSEQKNEIDVLSKTFAFQIKYSTVNIWKTKSNIIPLLKRRKINSKYFDKFLGGITLGVITEIYGKLIDSKQIPFGNKYIEPFTSYKVAIENELIKPNIQLLGNQGFELIYSLESMLINGTIDNIRNHEARYLNDVKCVKEDFKILKDIEVDNAKTLIWLIPLIIKHSDKLVQCDAFEFRKELEKVLCINNIETNVEIQWSIILFAGFSACAIANNMWSNSQQGIILSGELINKLKESVVDFLYSDINKHESEVIITKTREIYSLVKMRLESFEYQKITELSYKINHDENSLLNNVLSSLCVLWATDTMSTDWYNVFNRAYNGRIENLTKIFPILGVWMGFLHGYKMINKRKLFEFSNDEYLEKIGINAIKSLFDESYSTIEEANSILRIKNISKSNISKSLCVARFKNSFEIPILFKNVDYNLEINAKRKASLKYLFAKYEELKTLEKEFEKLLFDSFHL